MRCLGGDLVCRWHVSCGTTIKGGWDYRHHTHTGVVEFYCAATGKAAQHMLALGMPKKPCSYARFTHQCFTPSMRRQRLGVPATDLANDFPPS